MIDSHVILEAASFLLFAVAAAIMAATPAQPEGTFSPTAKWSIVGALSMFVLKCAVSVYDGMVGAPELLAQLAPLELMFVPAMLLAAESVYQRQLLEDIRAEHAEAVKAREIALHVMDSAPSGILVLDDSGDILYANHTACSVLDLERGEDPGDITGPGWVVRDIEGREAPNFRAITGRRKLGGVPLRVTWPEGHWLVDLVVSTAPLEGDDGTIAAFPVPSRMLSAFNAAAEPASGIM